LALVKFRFLIRAVLASKDWRCNVLHLDVLGHVLKFLLLTWRYQSILVPAVISETIGIVILLTVSVLMSHLHWVFICGVSVRGPTEGTSCLVPLLLSETKVLCSSALSLHVDDVVDA